MRLLASLTLLAAVAAAQAPLGDYQFVQLHLRGSRKPLARNLGGVITFDAGGSYTLRARMATGEAAAQPLTASGNFQVSPAGTVSMTNPAKADARLRVRSGDGGRFLLGSSVDSGEEDYDLFIAFKAGTGITAADVRGEYGAAYLSLARGDSAGLATAFVELEADGAGGFPHAAVNGHLASVDDTMRREQIMASTYAIRSDGTGTATFAEGSEVLARDREILVAPGGGLILGFSTSPAQRDIFIAVRKNPDVAAFLFRGPYWISELLAENDFEFNPEGARFGAAAGTASSNGDGTATVAQRVQMAGRRTNLTTLNRYYLGTGAPSMLGPALRVGLANIAFSDDFALFAGAQVGATGELALDHGIFVGVRQTRRSASGVFLDPAGIANSAAPVVPGASVAPGALITLTGSGLAASRVRATADPLLELGGVRVTFNGEAAPLRAVSPESIEAVVPSSTAPGLAAIQATVDGKASNVIEVDVASTSPALFSNTSGVGWAAAYHPDFAPITPARPAEPSEIVILTLAGLSSDLNDLAALFSGRPGEIEFAGAMPGFVGVYQINVKLPEELPPGESAAVAIRTADSFTDLAELPVKSARQ
ncbi:MAG: hypothetical protein U0Q16_08450 [Bryobacteraceae bacterium]